MTTRIAAWIVLVCTLATCKASDEVGVSTESPSAAAASERLLLTSVWAPADIEGTELRVIVSAEIANGSDRPVTIEAIEPANVDSLVEARFIGHSDCQLGCVGAANWNPEDAARAKRGTTLNFPLVLEVDERRFLTFELRLVSLRALALLESRCRAGIRSLRVTLSGEASSLVHGPGAHVAGVQWSETCAE
ncbi:MAG TPA: hypothetical protein VGB83_09000 [Actinomycetota bacterium]